VASPQTPLGKFTALSAPPDSLARFQSSCFYGEKGKKRMEKGKKKEEIENGKKRERIEVPSIHILVTLLWTSRSSQTNKVFARGVV